MIEITDATWEDAEQAVFSTLVNITERKVLVLTRRFGIGEQKTPETLEAIASEYGVTRERIRSIEASALRDLRRNPSTHRTLREALEVFNSYQHSYGAFLLARCVAGSEDGKIDWPAIRFLRRNRP